MLKHLLNLFFPRICRLHYNFINKWNSHLYQLPAQYSVNKSFDDWKWSLQKIYGEFPLNMLLLYFHKKGIVQELIHNLKRTWRHRNVTRHWYAEDLKDVFAVHKPDVIIPVPLHRRKYKERGYNQVSTFGLALSKELDISYNKKLLTNTNGLPKTQSKKTY
jgi:predicted amidophosphoribosyltransferase